jgi:hypothetical protein
MSGYWQLRERYIAGEEVLDEMTTAVDAEVAAYIGAQEHSDARGATIEREARADAAKCTRSIRRKEFVTNVVGGAAVVFAIMAVLLVLGMMALAMAREYSQARYDHQRIEQRISQWQQPQPGWHEFRQLTPAEQARVNAIQQQVAQIVIAQQDQRAKP